MNREYKVTFSKDELIDIMVALKDKIDQFAGQVSAFEGKEQYAKEYERAKKNLRRTTDLLKKITEVSPL